MGLDCIIKTDKDYHMLGRWFVFSKKFRSGQKLSRSEAIKELRNLNKTKQIEKDVCVWEDRSWEFFQYHKNWIRIARKSIKKKVKVVILFNDQDVPDEFYNTLRRP